ncbi:MAG: peptide-methionine (R)-S-oxide reductase MsrB [Bradymonadia bacterium]|jgi:peptide methionine sulfoxide reductase msrA/msrB
MKIFNLLICIIASVFVVFACSPSADKAAKAGEIVKLKASQVEGFESIVVAGGCFWGVEAYFQRVAGVLKTEAAYTNGNSRQTSYNELQNSGHAEAVRIDYDANKISLEEILLHYFRIIDPSSLNKQGNDVGRQYRTGIYYESPAQKRIIDKVVAQERKKHDTFAVEVRELENYVSAESYHQNYLQKNPNGYCHINPDAADKALDTRRYDAPNKDELKSRLDPLAYQVLFEAATERPHSSALNSETRKGIYVDKSNGDPLFSSAHKFDAGCGWPSFSRPILNKKVLERADTSHGMQRSEVISNSSKGHLGHVFEDGPKELGGLRYCINGAALEFIPYEEMEKRGYGQYKLMLD